MNVNDDDDFWLFWLCLPPSPLKKKRWGGVNECFSFLLLLLLLFLIFFKRINIEYSIWIWENGPRLQYGPRLHGFNVFLHEGKLGKKVKRV